MYCVLATGGIILVYEGIYIITHGTDGKKDKVLNYIYIYSHCYSGLYSVYNTILKA